MRILELAQVATKARPIGGTMTEAFDLESIIGKAVIAALQESGYTIVKTVDGDPSAGSQAAEPSPRRHIVWRLTPATAH